MRVALKVDVDTFRGTVDKQLGAVVAGGVMPDGVWATIALGADEQYWIEPVAGRVFCFDVNWNVRSLHGMTTLSDSCPTGFATSRSTSMGPSVLEPAATNNVALGVSSIRSRNDESRYSTMPVHTCSGNVNPLANGFKTPAVAWKPEPCSMTHTLARPA